MGLYSTWIILLYLLFLASEESVIPGDRTEMADFIEETSKSTMFKVVINLRSVEIAFPSKHFFEELYNRYVRNTLSKGTRCSVF